MIEEATIRMDEARCAKVKEKWRLLLRAWEDLLHKLLSAALSCQSAQ